MHHYKLITCAACKLTNLNFALKLEKNSSGNVKIASLARLSRFKFWREYHFSKTRQFSWHDNFRDMIDRRLKREGWCTPQFGVSWRARKFKFSWIPNSDLQSFGKTLPAVLKVITPTDRSLTKRVWDISKAQLTSFSLSNYLPTPVSMCTVVMLLQNNLLIRVT